MADHFVIKQTKAKKKKKKCRTRKEQNQIGNNNKSNTHGEIAKLKKLMPFLHSGPWCLVVDLPLKALGLSPVSVQ